MKKRTKKYSYSALFLLLLLLTACQSDQKEAAKPKSPENETAPQSENENSASETDTVKEEEGSMPAEETSGETKTEEVSSTVDKEDETEPEEAANAAESEEDLLADYSSEEVEYARVWLQLGPNQEIDELNVRLIPAGTPLNPDDETSAGYPEDVIQLAGSRLVDGSVTYSGNGDGTVNVYNVPLRWDGQYPAGEQFYQDLISNTKTVSIGTGNDEAIVKLIKKIKISQG
ncbi:hypothetical protein [Metabacillus sp. 84]|uniref:hypothetical protein n=1 Tax=Metabacillus sp. 84 TaxID=3404705 RepID=UPI003CFAC84C